MTKKTLKDARAARDEAIGQVDRAADERWKACMSQAVHHVASLQYTFSSEDVIEAYDELGFDASTRDLRALGAVMRRAAKDGICKKSGEYMPSIRRHCTPIVVWESLILA